VCAKISILFFLGVSIVRFVCKNESDGAKNIVGWIMKGFFYYICIDTMQCALAADVCLLAQCVEIKYNLHRK
jgi:hypothetical protein